MKNLLISWIGATDLRSMLGHSETGNSGPIIQACSQKKYAHIILLSNYSPQKNTPFVQWLQTQVEGKVIFRQVNLSSPTNYGEVYPAALDAVEWARENCGENAGITFHLSPGTSAMAAVWVLLAKTKYPDVTLIESSIDHGVNEVTIPFSISLDFIPHLYRQSGQRVEQLAAGSLKDFPEFEKIYYQSQIMREVIHKAKKVAVYPIPVLIEGESGTGKELFARAIHNASTRKGKFISINCGAIPGELVESELFGHEKGSFTGATEKKVGHFEAAHGGTIFLDEIGELPKDIQVKLLRTLQEHEVKPVGATESKTVDIRIIAATNRTLSDEIGNGSFREDLFYRLAVAVIRLPALRERIEDISLLIDFFVERINSESKSIPGYTPKTISAAGINLLKNHPWPGNVRELQNTLTRAMVWADGEILSKADIREALLDLPAQDRSQVNILEKSLGDEFDINQLLEKIRSHYYRRALAQTHGNKSKAAELLGLANYQTLTSWLKKSGK